MSVEVWDQASDQNHVLQVENQFFNLLCSQWRVNVRSTTQMCCFDDVSFCCKRILYTDFLYMLWFTSCHHLNITCEYSWFNNNNSVTIKGVKNLCTGMNCTYLVTPQTKFQSPPVKDKRIHSFLVS